MYYDFQKDRLIGEESERKFADLLYLKYSKHIKNIFYNRDKRFDLLVDAVDGRQITFQIKRDLMAHKTGNIAIETFSRGKNSGINSTIANYFVIHCFYENKEHFYVFKTEILKEFINKNNFREVFGGDKDEYGNFTTKMVLLPLKEILRNEIYVKNYIIDN